MGPIIYAGDHRDGRYPTLTVSFAEVPLVFACMSDESTERAAGPNRAVRIAANAGQGACLVLKWKATVDPVAWGRLVDVLHAGDALQLLHVVNVGVRRADVPMVEQAVGELERMLESAAGLASPAV